MKQGGRAAGDVTETVAVIHCALPCHVYFLRSGSSDVYKLTVPQQFILYLGVLNRGRMMSEFLTVECRVLLALVVAKMRARLHNADDCSTG